MASATQIAPQPPRQKGFTAPSRRFRPSSHKDGVQKESIEGRYRQIPTQTLCLAWWLYSSRSISKRQLRVFFAAQEMSERRRYAQDPETRPIYRLSEIKRLVGGQGSTSATTELRHDVRQLAKIGLVTITKHKILFASSPEQIAIEDLSGFWDMWSNIANKRRSIPVPRRTLRALAAGFSKGTTAVVIAMLIRSVFWHREKSSLRVDGRTKRQWIADVMGVSLRAIAEGRAKLIELEWLIPMDARQWELNRWGSHDTINVDWQPENEASNDGVGEGTCSKLSTECGDKMVDKPVDSEACPQNPIGESAPLKAQNGSESAPLYKTSILLPTEENLRTRTLGGEPPDPAGSLLSVLKRKKASRKKEGARPGRSRKRRGKERSTDSPPDLRDVRAEDLRNTDALLELHRQAVEAGIANNSTGGKLDFLSFAERARSRGDRPEAMFMWLIRGNRRAFITQADEDGAAARLREHFHGPDTRRSRSQGSDASGLGFLSLCGGASDIDGGEGTATVLKTFKTSQEQKDSGGALCEDEKLVQACIIAAKLHRVADPFRIAREAKGWDQDRWDTALLGYRANQSRRWYHEDTDGNE